MPQGSTDLLHERGKVRARFGQCLAVDVDGRRQSFPEGEAGDEGGVLGQVHGSMRMAEPG